MPERTYRSRHQTQRARTFRRDVSGTEHRLWPYLRNSALGVAFRRQHPIGGYFPDYYCVPLKLAVEVDGPLHTLERDSTRDANLAAIGITTLRFSYQQIEENLEGVITTIRYEIWLLQNRKG